MNVYVVLGECGEYSDLTVFVSGVFMTLQEAQSAVSDVSTRRERWDSWHQRYLRELLNKPFGYIYSDDEQAAAAELAGPKPPYELSERATIFGVEVGIWNSAGFEEVK